MSGTVIAVASSMTHSFSKGVCESINLLEGVGVERDIHSGKTVKHRSRVKVDPAQPNLRQVHLIHAELFGELHQLGFEISAGQLGENITTRGVDLLGLPKGTILQLGESAAISVTGLRNPCVQLNRFKKGLLNAVLTRDEHGNIIRKAGVMGIVLVAGGVKRGDEITVVLPDEPYQALERV